MIRHDLKNYLKRAASGSLGQNAWLIVFVACMIGVVVLFGNARFSANDDPEIIRQMRNGFLVLFMSVPLGAFLSVLYCRISQAVPWYPLFLYLVHGVSLFLILRTSLKIFPEKKVFVPLMGAILIFYAVFLIGLTYTVAAFMIGGAGLYAFLVSAKGNIHQSRVALGYGLCLAAAYLIRCQTGLGILVFSFPVVLYFFWKRCLPWKAVVVFLLPVILATILNWASWRFILPEGYHRLAEFSAVGGKFLDSPAVVAAHATHPEIVQKILQENEWTWLDYSMLANWMFLNEKKFNTHTLQTIAQYAPMIRTAVSARIFIRSVQIIFKEYWHFFLLMAAIMVLVILRRRRTLALFSAAYAVYLAALAVLMHVFYRFPSRVGQPMFFLGLLLMIALLYLENGAYFLGRPDLEREPAARQANHFYKAWYAFLILLFCIAGYQGFKKDFLNQMAANTAKARAHTKIVQQLNARYHGKILIADPFQMQPEGEHLLKPIKKEFKMITGGWRIYSPGFYQELEDFLGLENAYEIFPEMANNPDVYLLASDVGAMYILRYMIQTYGGQYVLRSRDPIGENQYVFDFQQVDFSTGR